MSQTVKLRRRDLCITQADLSHASGVSLPTIQNIEAERANPSLRILERLFRALGLRWEILVEPVDLEELISLGLPMAGAGGGHARVGLQRTEARLVSQCRLAASSPELEGRALEALRGLLMAIALHFPSVFQRSFARSAVIAEVMRSPATPRELKLYRIARSTLAEYL